MCRAYTSCWNRQCEDRGICCTQDGDFSHHKLLLTRTRSFSLRPKHGRVSGALPKFWWVIENRLAHPAVFYLDVIFAAVGCRVVANPVECDPIPVSNKLELAQRLRILPVAEPM